MATMKEIAKRPAEFEESATLLSLERPAATPVERVLMANMRLSCAINRILLKEIRKLRKRVRALESGPKY
jgi:hypothetical protein